VRLASIIIAALAHCADYSKPEKPDAPASGVILISGSDFATGFLSAIDPGSLKVYKDILPIYNDSILRYDAGTTSTYVLQRLGSDSVRKLDNNSGYLTQFEKSVGTKMNPQDLTFLPGNAMSVSLYNRSAIVILSRSTGAQIAEIDLSSYSDADGYAEIGSLFYNAGYLYALVQRLNRAATDAIWPPVGDSYLLKIDTATYQVTQTLLTYANPVSRIHFHALRNSLIFAAPGRFAANYALDGACLEFDLASGTLLPVPMTEVQAGYEIADCNIQNDGSGIFVGYDANLNSVFGSFNTTTHAVTRVAAFLSSSNGGYFSEFLLHSNGKVYLADRNIFTPGIRVFSGPTLGEETAKAVYTGLPPYSFEEVP
jgi:hypothetical protein